MGKLFIFIFSEYISIINRILKSDIEDSLLWSLLFLLIVFIGQDQTFMCLRKQYFFYTTYIRAKITNRWIQDGEFISSQKEYWEGYHKRWSLFNNPRQTYTLTGLRICLPFPFSSFFFGTVTSEHTCLRLHCDWSMILAFGHLREQEIYIFTRMPLYRVSAWSWRTIPLIDLSTNKVYSRVKLSRMPILSFPFGDLYCIDSVDFMAFHCTVSDTTESYNA